MVKKKKTDNANSCIEAMVKCFGQHGMNRWSRFLTGAGIVEIAKTEK